MTKRFRQGGIHAIITARDSKNGPFWSYTLERYAGNDDEGKPRYFKSFTPRDNENLGKVISEAITFMDSNDPADALSETQAE